MINMQTKVKKVITMKHKSDLIKRPFSQVFPELCVYIVCGAAFFFTAFLTVASFITTTDVNLENACSENVIYPYDNPILGLVCATAFFFLLLGVRKISRKIPESIFVISCAVVTAVFGCIFVFSARSVPVNDSLSVCQAAYSASVGNWEYFKEPYFYYYPFQLGYVLFCEIFIRIFRTGENYLVMQYVNVFCLELSYLALIKISAYLTEKEEVRKLTAFMLTMCMPAVFFCTFTYGNVPGLAFMLLSFLCFYRFEENEKIGWGILSAVFMGIAVALKMNYAIALIALCAVWAVRIIEKKKAVKRIVCIVLAAGCVLSFRSAAITVYEKRSGLDFGDGIPMTSWAAMGLNESNGPGWYNGKYTVHNFDDCGRDAEKANEKSIQAIKERLSYFSGHPFYAIGFFSAKLLSQWNEPSYQSIWNMQVRITYAEKGAIADYVTGNGEYTLKAIMNREMGIFLPGVLLGLYYLIKKKDIKSSLLPLFLLGTFLYHLIFEAKAQYSLVYVLVMFPIAACGLEIPLSRVEEKIILNTNKKTTSFRQI